MAIPRLLAWLRKRAPEESDAARIERLMSGLACADRETRIGAQTVFKTVIYNNHGDYSPEFTCAMLQSLAQRSDLKDYHWILRFVGYLGQPPAGVRIDPEVRNQAAICLQRLRERYEPEYAAQSLLHVPEAAQTGDVLLRPARGHTDTQEEMLLRADAATAEKQE